MARRSHLRRSSPRRLGLACALALACGSPSTGDDESAGATGEATTAETSGASATTATAGTSGASATTGATTGASSTTANLSTSGMSTDTSGTTDSTGTIGTTDTTDSDTSDTTGTSTTTTTTMGTSMGTTMGSTGGDGLPNDSMCSADVECSSNHCTLIPLLGGYCGECEKDAECPDGGCTPPNPFAELGAKCNLGEPGAGCESDAVCSDPKFGACGLALDAAPIQTVMTCGACKSNADCKDPGKPNCSPDLDIANFTGINVCVADGALANDASCDYHEEGGVPLGNKACASGKCGTAAFQGVIKVGVCGECFTDQECGGTCSDPVVDPNTFELQGATCN